MQRVVAAWSSQRSRVGGGGGGGVDRSRLLHRLDRPQTRGKQHGRQVTR